MVQQESVECRRTQVSVTEYDLEVHDYEAVSGKSKIANLLGLQRVGY